MTWHDFSDVAFWASMSPARRALWCQRAAWIAIHPKRGGKYDGARYLARYTRAINMFARTMRRLSPDLRVAVDAVADEPRIRLDSVFWTVFKVAVVEERRRRRRG